VSTLRKFQLRVEGQRVHVNIGDRTFLELDASACRDMGKALLQAAARAEEVANAPKIALDGAILLRAGVPIGLTDNPAIQEMVKVEAGHNRTLRRSMPGGIKSTSIVGTPALIQHAPKPS